MILLQQTFLKRQEVIIIILENPFSTFLFCAQRKQANNYLQTYMHTHTHTNSPQRQRLKSVTSHIHRYTEHAFVCLAVLAYILFLIIIILFCFTASLCKATLCLNSVILAVLSTNIQICTYEQLYLLLQCLIFLLIL